MILFSVVLNSFVHVIMYSYYFAALFGPTVQRKLESIKKSITVIQMVCDIVIIFDWSIICSKFVFSLIFILFPFSDSIHHHTDTMRSRFGQRLRCAKNIDCHLCAKCNIDILYVLRFLQNSIQKEINRRRKGTESTLGTSS